MSDLLSWQARHQEPLDVVAADCVKRYRSLAVQDDGVLASIIADALNDEVARLRAMGLALLREHYEGLGHYDGCQWTAVEYERRKKEWEAAP